ncbi:putative imidazolonepropionase [Gastrophryne carolinensis]
MAILIVVENLHDAIPDEKMLNLIIVAHDQFTNVVYSDGFIKAIGPAETIRNQFSQAEFEMVIDCSEKCALPGFVDAHTHPVWAGDRVHEFAMKLAGATYMDIHQAGGGIHYTVDKTEAASEEELYNSFKERLERILRTGTTLVECKSGYGLKLETELKMLRVIERAQRELDIDISSTYCGAHSVPKGKTAETAADDIVENHLPALKQLAKNDEIHVDNIDVFCEKGVFDLVSTRRILQAGKDIGLHINFHGDELHPMKSAEQLEMLPQNGRFSTRRENLHSVLKLVPRWTMKVNGSFF